MAYYGQKKIENRYPIFKQKQKNNTIIMSKLKKMTGKLMGASEFGHLDVVNKLLDCKEIDVNVQNQYGYTALIRASFQGHSDVVNRLLECKEIDVNLQDKYGETALIEASMRGHLDVGNRLIEL